MERFVPKLDGHLRASATFDKDGVTYDTPYARAQFYGSGYTKKASFTFRRYTTSGTGKRWDLCKVKTHHCLGPFEPNC